MKIVNIVPGFGGSFYCGNCLRDSAYVNSLREMGHEAITLPMYLPLTINGETSNPDVPVFYGAVNIYLKQQFPLFRHMPGWMEHLLDSRPVLKFAAGKSGATRAHGLEQLTESMLLGQDGFQNHELGRVVDFLKNHEKPDVVHFSNALLLGMAKQVRDEVKVPVVYSLQDEDVWVDAMDPSWQGKIWELMSEKSRDVDAFISVSDYFAAVMQKKMNIPADRMNVVHIGVTPENYAYSNPALSPPAIGYLSRICKENGFEVLVDSFILLKKESRFKDLRLIVTGGMTGDDRSFLHRQIKKLKKNKILQDIEIRPDFSIQGLQDFFRSLSVLSVPVLKGEAYGLYQIESLASGVPLVQPDLGAFSEIIHATGGGILYQPNTPDALAAKFAEVLSDVATLEKMSLAGRKSVEADFDCRKLTKKMVEVYEKVIL
ncbi:MAG: glycosyltransferase family 4 protein [Bacteroidales bacterium]|nr:glycosyltransferase family 4 protein [Bacteroidales bacterium]